VATHLLEAIANGSVHNSVVEVAGNMPMLQPSGPVRLLSTGSAAAMNVPVAQSTYMSVEAQSMPQPEAIPFDSARQMLLNPFNAQLEQLIGEPLFAFAGGQDPWRLGEAEVIRRAGNRAEPEQIADLFAAAASAMANPFSSGVSAPNQAMVAGALAPIARIATKLGVPILSVTQEQARALRPWGTDQFQADLATLFGRYRDAALKNQLARLQDNANGTSSALNEEAFRSTYGAPPWDEISALFQSFRLPYIATPPNLYDFSPVSFSLQRQDTGDAVAPTNLSSGEKILLQFAISSISYDDDLTRVTRPSLLLLDEMDAPLHPEMVHYWLTAVQSGIVEEQGINCILTTHSPTTIALAPEEAMFEMRDGRSGLRKISKQDALNRLTFGVPMLSIDYSGRRQIFTESDTDAAIYERVYSLVKGRINCTRELKFLSTGMRNKDGGEINSGCTVVTNIVQRLNETGNMSVFGIVDWDGGTTSTDRVRVVAEGTHDGIENLLLDPLLICLLLLKERRPPEGLDDIDRFAGADTLNTADIQRLVDAVQHRVLPGNTNGPVAITYLGGETSNVLRDYATMDDHALEDALRAAFPYLRKWSNRGALVMAVVEEVLTEHRVFCPAPLRYLFEGVANA